MSVLEEPAPDVCIREVLISDSEIRSLINRHLFSFYRLMTKLPEKNSRLFPSRGRKACGQTDKISVIQTAQRGTLERGD